ncbi:MAG: beta-galactosidase, partial [Bacteroidota bacterium]|nr:beta-galactosidase [Bacteroidota bacterium]
IDIVSAKAGANEDKVALSYDDNETTEWSSSGLLSTGWITYQLDREALVSEICLKLGGFRSRSYPLEILVDGKLVWKGNTPQSLGYVTLPLTPTKGKSVTIRLTGSNVEKDAFNNMIEVSGKKLKDSGNNSVAGNSKGQLHIIEAEIYEVVK